MTLRPALTAAEAAELAGVHYHTILREIERGNLRAGKPAGQWRIDPVSFDAWLYGPPAGDREPRPPRRSPRQTQHGGRVPRGSLASLDAIERGEAA